MAATDGCVSQIAGTYVLRFDQDEVVLAARSPIGDVEF